MKIELEKIATFGVAGNFTGHLEQAGESKDFINIKTAEECAPKGIFPTYLPLSKKDEKASVSIPDYLTVFPFDESKIIFPQNEQNIQIEPECAILFDVEWNCNCNLFFKNDAAKLRNLKPIAFFASNDCSIRKEGARKISQKKNWGLSSKGYAISSPIYFDDFSSDGIINDYNIVSFILRDNQLIQYGENSSIKDYSYVYGKLITWLIDKLNNQKDEGPLENLNQYLLEINRPSQIIVSIGATRYTDFGEKNYLKKGDQSIIVLYPRSNYSLNDINQIILDKKNIPKDISLLSQIIE